MNIFRDIKYGSRLLLKQPKFAAVVVLAVALGTGANTAIFSLVDSVLLRPLPFPSSSGLVVVSFNNPQFPHRGMGFTPDAAAEVRSQTKEVMSGLGTYDFSPMSWTDNGESTVMVCGFASQGFFEALGVNPTVGRFFLPEEFEGGKDDVAVLSDEMWRTRFHADPKTLGRTLALNGKPYVIVGIAPPALHFLALRFEGSVGAWLPLPTRGAMEAYLMLARLQRHTALRGVQASLDIIARRLAAQDPKKYREWSLEVEPLHQLVAGDEAPALLLLLGATSLVFVIAIVNVTNLLFARGWQRAKEIALQITLGASRFHVVLQWAIEGCLVSLFGSIAGVLLAFSAVRIFRNLGPIGVFRFQAPHVNWHVLAFSVGIGVLAGLLIGSIPAIRISRLDPNAVMHGADGSGRAGGSVQLRRAMSKLMVVEIALAFAVSASSALLIRSLAKLTSVRTGIRTDNVLTLRVFIPPGRYEKYSEHDRWKPFLQSLLANVRSVPGVDSVAVSNLPLLMGISFENKPVEVNGRTLNINDHRTVTSGCFWTLGIPILAGHDIGDDGSPGELNSVIVNQLFAQTAWGDPHSVGHEFNLIHDGQPVPVDVVGVVSNFRDDELTGAIRPSAYLPLIQHPFDGLAFVLHTAVAPASLTTEVERQIWSVDPNLAITHVHTMTSLIANNEVGPRFRTWLLGAFALLGLILAALGVYGVFSYTMTRRTHEFGVRMALGAARRDVLRLAMIDSVRLAAIGVAIGLAAIFIIAPVMRSFVFGVTATDPATLGITAIVITVTSLVACYLPASRASHTDPAVALRHE